MAVVVPREHRIVISKTSVSITTGRVSLPRLFGTSELGDGFGVAAGKFSSPISMDVASDNHMYVLDAGNSSRCSTVTESTSRNGGHRAATVD